MCQQHVGSRPGGCFAELYAANVRAKTVSQGRIWLRSHWAGCATWCATHSRGNAMSDLAKKFDAKGALWCHLRAGLFSGDEGRTTEAFEEITAAAHCTTRQLRQDDS